MLIPKRPGRLLSLVGCLLVFQITFSQQVSLSLKDALKFVETNLPQLEAYRQQTLAAKENIALAKNSLVPEVNAGYQLNIATYNNITGMSYPGFLLPISGPPSQTNDMNFVPGSVLGTLIKWNPITFGQRNAAMEKAGALFKEAGAVYNEQLFRYQCSALNSYLEAIYTRQVIKAIQAGINRNKTGLDQALVLATTGLKQGIDTTQFQAAITQGEIDLLQAEKAYLQKLTELCNLTGISYGTGSVILTDSSFKEQVPMIPDTAAITSHPLYQTMAAHQQTTESELREIKKSWVPQLDIWGNLYTRASGIDAQGVVNKADGFRFSRTNAGLGLQLSFPLLQFSKVNIKKKQYNLLLKAGEANLEQASRNISQQTQYALVQYWQDIKIAAQTPVLLKTAKDVYEGLRISYEAGLIDYTRLSQAQYDLIKAELNQAGAQLQLWHSLLAVAVAKGNLDIFLTQLK